MHIAKAETRERIHPLTKSAKGVFSYQSRMSEIHSDEGLTLETSAFQSPYDGQFT